jgi:uncharacterized Ntn-hydrolase superfamily protein
VKPISAGYTAPMTFAHTYSIVARDPATGQFGVAVQSHWFAVGSLVPWARAGVGAVATQSFVEPSYGPEALVRMQSGRSAESALADLVAADPGRDLRQVGMVGATGNAAAWTGSRCVAAAGHHVGDGFCVQANMMASPLVWPSMAQAYTSTQGDLATRMLAALDAAESAGGDARGRQSAALVVVGAEFSATPWTGRVFDLRVDDHADPLGELRRLVGLQRAYNHMNAGDAAIERNDTATAAAEYAAAEGLNPGSAEMVFWHAVAVANSGDSGGAEPLFGRCFEMDPRWPVMVPRVVKSGLLKHPPG